MKKIFSSIVILSLCVLLGCTKGGEFEGFSDRSYSVTSALDGSQVMPAVSIDTTKGVLNALYDEQANILAFTLSYTKDVRVVKKDVITGVHFYKQKAEVGTTVPDRSFTVAINVDGTNADPLKRVNVSGSLNLGLSGATALKAEEKAGFMAGNWYVVLITQQFPKGIAAGKMVLTVN